MLLFLFSFCHQPVLHGRAEQDFLPFSVWYSGGKARAPMLEPVDASSRERWRVDLRQIKDLGFNAVRTWVEWTANEPRPGEMQFENLELVAELCQELGLRFLVQVYTDSAPDWVGSRFRDARFVAQSGEVIPSQSAPGYCFDHPEVRERILGFYRATAEVVARYPNFAGWDLWSEPHIINWAIIDYVPNATFCYCPSSMARFRSWLKGKYGTLDALNRSWYRTFSDWEQVEPPRFGTILSYTDFIDWRLFVREKLAGDLKDRADAVRQVNPDFIVTSHAAVPGLFTSPLWGVGAPDDWLMAESVDYWGTSIYPKHSFPDRHWSLLTLSSLVDFIRSSGQASNGFYVGELQAGMGIRGTVVGDPVTAEDQRLWVLTLLARGARAINVYAYYPMNSGYEAGGYGLINLDGTPTERSRKLGALARTVDKNRELFLKSTPFKSDVAIVYNPLAYLVGGEQHLAPGGVVRESLQGIYQAFWRRNVYVDFVHLREVERGRLRQYKTAFLPYPLMLTEKAASQFAAYVREGGTLVAEARCGWNDDRGYSQDVIPGFGLHKVFRVREGDLKMVEKVPLRIEASLSMPEGPAPGSVLIGKGIMEELLPGEGAEVVARFEDGRVAATLSRHGRGKAIAVGSFLSVANAQEQNPATEAFFLSIALGAGAAPVLGGLPKEGFIEARLLESGAEQLAFFFNHEDRPLRVQLNAEEMSDLESGVRLPKGELTLAPREIRVIRARGLE